MKSARKPKQFRRLTSFIIAIIMIFNFSIISFAGIRDSYPGTSTYPYSSAVNPYSINSSTGGNCTWYAFGRCLEVTGHTLPKWGNAGTWYQSAINAGYQTGTTPRANSIMCWTTSSTAGHVAFCESVSGDVVTWTESNWSGPKFRTVSNNHPWTYLSNSSLHYIYINAQPIPDTNYIDVKEANYNIVNVSSGRYLNAFANAGSAAKNTNICISNGDGTNEQRFRIQAIGNKQYYIRSLSNGNQFCVNAMSGNTVTSGNDVKLWEYNSDPSKFWYFKDAGNGNYYIVNVKNPNVVITATSNDHRANVIVQNYSGSALQQWRLVEEHTTHNYSSSVTKNPTCTEQGVKTYTCTVCGQYYTEAIPSIGHNYGSWTKINDNQHQRVCKNDSSHKETANHNWDSGSVTKNPTCTVDGVKTLTCSVCKCTKTESIPAIGHSFGEWKTLDDNQHQRVCSNDSTHIEKEEHTWDNGEITKEPTDSSEGEIRYKCTVCNTVKTEPIEKLIHSDKKGEIIVGSATAPAGSTVTIAIKLEKNIPVNVIRGALTYDTEALELVDDPVNGDLFDDLGSGKSLVWTAKQNVEKTGVLALFTFKINQNAEEGKYEVVFNPYDASNKEADSVSFDVINGFVTVSDAICGDVNGDGEVDPKDLSKLLTYFVEYDWVTGQSSIPVSAGADVNGDGEITAPDLSRLLTYFVEYDYVTKTSPVKLGEYKE